jgi:hypothetical protein
VACGDHSRASEWRSILALGQQAWGCIWSASRHCPALATRRRGSALATWRRRQRRQQRHQRQQRRRQRRQRHWSSMATQRQWSGPVSQTFRLGPSQRASNAFVVTFGWSKYRRADTQEIDYLTTWLVFLWRPAASRSAIAASCSSTDLAASSSSTSDSYPCCTAPRSLPVRALQMQSGHAMITSAAVTVVHPTEFK